MIIVSFISRTSRRSYPPVVFDSFEDFITFYRPRVGELDFQFTNVNRYDAKKDNFSLEVWTSEDEKHVVPGYTLDEIK